MAEFSSCFVFGASFMHLCSDAVDGGAVDGGALESRKVKLGRFDCEVRVKILVSRVC